VLSVAVISVDAATGPYILFPIAFVVSVGLAAWHLGRAPAIGFAVVLVACRFAIATTLEGILPICSFCKKIRRPDGEWEGLEVYISERSTAQFSHGLCTTCEREHYGSA
jgi:hypothetical protein